MPDAGGQAFFGDKNKPKTILGRLLLLPYGRDIPDYRLNERISSYLEPGQSFRVGYKANSNQEDHEGYGYKKYPYLYCIRR